MWASLIPLALSYMGKQGVFGANDSKTTIEESPEQKQARALLSKIAAGTDSGSAYTGETGNYNLSDLQVAAKNKIAGNLGSGMPEGLAAGQKEILSLLNEGTYDPTNEKYGVYAGMKRNLLKESQDAGDVINREAARTGKLSAGRVSRSRQQVASDTGNKLQDIISGLYQDYGNKRLTAAQTAANMGVQEENINSGRINQAASMGGIEQLLADAKAKAGYAEWQRTRGEKLDAISKLSGLGPSSVPVVGGDPWNSLMQTAISGFGTGLAKSGDTNNADMQKILELLQGKAA